jgi:hypothetical protein
MDLNKVNQYIDLCEHHGYEKTSPSSDDEGLGDQVRDLSRFSP